MEARTLIRDKADGSSVNPRQAAQPLEKPEPGKAPAAWPRLLVAAVSSGLLLWACYFPLAWGWLAWVALVPLLCLVRSEARAWKIYGAALVSGLIFFWASIQWMRVADYRMYATWAMLATYCALYFPVTIFLLRRLERRSGWPLVIILPLVWTGLEFFRSWFGTGFAWYFLGHTQHPFLPLIQIADLGGAYTVSFLVAAVNGWLFELCFTRCWFRTFFGLPAAQRHTARGLALQGGFVLVLLAGTLGYGVWRLHDAEVTPGPRVALLQGNIDQRLRNEATKSGGPVGDMFNHYRELCRTAALAPVHPDLIVWPETSFPVNWNELARNESQPDLLWPVAGIAPHGFPANAPWLWLADQSYRQQIEFRQKQMCLFLASFRSSVLVGLNAEVWSQSGRIVKRYCSGLLVRPDGTLGGRYDKMHRVPFGEYVPLRDVLPLMERFAPYDFDYSIAIGTQFTRFAVGPYSFGTLICFEDTDPYLARQYLTNAPDGHPVDFLVDISNDGWFDGSSEHDEHLAICRFRAVETRRAVARAVNMGISAVIDSDGRVLAPQEVRPGLWELNGSGSPAPSLPVSEWHRFKKTAGVLMATIPIDHRQSLYTLWGDWLGWGCLGTAFLALVWFGVVAAIRTRLGASPWR